METQCEATCRSGCRCMNKARIEGDNKKKLCMKHFNVMKQNDDCIICYEGMTPSTSIKLECGHFFHTTCIEIWSEHNETCPVCRKPIDVKTMMTINRNYIDLLGYMLFAMPKEKRNNVIYHIENLITRT